MAEVLHYRRKLEVTRRCPEGEATLLSMQNERDQEFRRIKDESRSRQLTTVLAKALGDVYRAYGDSLMTETIKATADQEARRRLNCGND
jgi:ribosomal protein L34E